MMPNDYGLADAEWSRDTKEPPEPKPVTHCARCHEGIFEGERYFEIYGETLCRDCADLAYGRYA